MIAARAPFTTRSLPPALRSGETMSFTPVEPALGSVSVESLPVGSVVSVSVPIIPGGMIGEPPRKPMPLSRQPR